MLMSIENVVGQDLRLTTSYLLGGSDFNDSPKIYSKVARAVFDFINRTQRFAR